MMVEWQKKKCGVRKRIIFPTFKRLLKSVSTLISQCTFVGFKLPVSVFHWIYSTYLKGYCFFFAITIYYFRLQITCHP